MNLTQSYLSDLAVYIGYRESIRENLYARRRTCRVSELVLLQFIGHTVQSRGPPKLHTSQIWHTTQRSVPCAKTEHTTQNCVVCQDRTHGTNTTVRCAKRWTHDTEARSHKLRTASAVPCVSRLAHSTIVFVPCLDLAHDTVSCVPCFFLLSVLCVVDRDTWHKGTRGT